MTLQATKIRVILLTLVAAFCAYGRPSRIVVVTPTAGDPIRSGNDLLSALAGISSPSASDPWLLKIEPGLYDLGTQALTMRPYVDVEGSGQGVTRVTSAGLNTVVAASNAELRQLRVENTNTDSHSTGQPCDQTCFVVLVAAGVNAKLTDLTITSPGNAWGLSVEMGAEAIVTGTTIDFPIFAFTIVNAGTATIEGSTIRVVDLASDGIVNSGTLRLANSVVDAGPGTNAIVTSGSGITSVDHCTLNGTLLEVFGGTTYVGASQVVNANSAPSVTGAKCVASYNATFDPLGADCQPLP